MPFVHQPLHVSHSVQPPFVGRAHEQQMFRQQILAPQTPATHLLNVWGPEGCGVSTLLARWREEACHTPFQDLCVRVTAEGHMGSPLRVMTAVATQLRVAGPLDEAFAGTSWMRKGGEDHEM